MKIELTDEVVRLLNEERLKRRYSMVDGMVLYKLGEDFEGDALSEERMLRYVIFKLLKDTWTHRFESGEDKNCCLENELAKSRVIES